jgi:hypothetical protein
MKDGRTVEGELLAVKGDLLIMMEASSLAGIEVQIGEVLYLKVNKKSKFLQGLQLGFLSGAATGGMIGLLSGDDEEGWFAWTAEQKALFGALGFGILGMSIGGIAGAIAGIDESIDLTSMSPAQMNLILNKLKSYSRIADELPQNLKILPSTPTKEEYKAVEKETPAASFKESGNGRSQPLRPEKINRFHFSVTPGYFNSSGLGKLQDLLKNIGFSGSESYSGFFGSGTIEYPHEVKGSYFYIKDLKIEYSLSKNFALGIAYSPLGEHGASGRHIIPNKYYWGGDAETYISGFYSGQVYFLTASYFPIPDAFLRKLTFKIMTGIGYGRVKMDFHGSEFEYYYENQSPYFPMDQKRFSKNALAALLSTELIYFFNKRWTLGINADYKYVPVKTDRFPIDCYYFYWDNLYADEMRHEALHVDMPGKAWNLGGLGFGLNFGFHF